jgi:hypothetical protein
MDTVRNINDVCYIIPTSGLEILVEAYFIAILTFNEQENKNKESKADILHDLNTQ